MSRDADDELIQGITLTPLLEAKKLADKLGGVERAQAAVNALAKLL